MKACARAGPQRVGLSLAEVLRAALAGQPPALSPHHRKILNTLLACQTPQLGGHRYRCEYCGREHFVPRSCGNRHCPNCQWHQAMEWLQRQEQLLLPIPYFHVVFTLPHALNPIIRQNRTVMYNLLFWAASQTLLEFGRNDLSTLSETQAFQAEVRKATSKSWNVYAKRPFAGPKQVLQYLSRYTHRVAITHRRLIQLNPAEGTIEFNYKKRRDQAPPVHQRMELELPEFLRRFCLHILPERFVKIRHYGLLANRGRQERVAQARGMLTGNVRPTGNEPERQLPDNATAKAEAGEAPRLLCPYCGRIGLVLVETVKGAARAPPNRESRAQ
ncbi:MAG: transposase [Verrucomicrobia bacterium]|nr:transposase [Verrucomicrobiota bacterium]